MIIDHNHPLYKVKRNKQGGDKYNGAYYYSKDIVKYIIPNIKTDRNWVTVRLPECEEDISHSIVFIHNNRNPNYYSYLKNYKDIIAVCSVHSTANNISFYCPTIFLPLSVNIESVKRYRCKKTKDSAFAGRKSKITNQVPKACDILTGMSQTALIKEMAKYKKIYAVGRTAIQAKILGCEIGVYDNKYPDVNFWKPFDCSEAVKLLQSKLDEFDK